MIYNMTSLTANVTNVSSMLDVFKYFNYLTGGFFWVGILFMLFAIFIIIFLKYKGIEIPLIASSVICMVLGGFLSFLGLISWEWNLFFVGVFVFVVIYIAYNSGRE